MFLLASLSADIKGKNLIPQRSNKYLKKYLQDHCGNEAILYLTLHITVNVSKSSGRSPELLEFREHTEHLKLGGAVWSQGLGSTVPVGPFQFKILF